MKLPIFRVRDVVLAPGSGYSSTEKLVALVIAFHMGPAVESWPSRRVLSAATGYSESTVRAALATLTAGPLALFDLVPGGARAGDRYGANRYRLKGADSRPAQGTGTRPPATVLRGPTGAGEGADRRVLGGRQELRNKERQEITEKSTALAPRGAIVPTTPAASWSTRACEVYARRFPDAVVPGGVIGRQLKPLQVKLTKALGIETGERALLAGWAAYLERTDPAYVSPARFASTFTLDADAEQQLSPTSRHNLKVLGFTGGPR